MMLISHACLHPTGSSSKRPCTVLRPLCWSPRCTRQQRTKPWAAGTNKAPSLLLKKQRFVAEAGILTQRDFMI